ncbi:MAG: ComEC/Rec2 family competence protein [Anaerolineales bacterium]|nr:ComEC/Rec2 family competence protein [Anaerolineales bacterium]
MLLFFLCIFWCGGIICSKLLSFAFWCWLILGCVSAISIIILRKAPAARRFFLFLLFFESGAIYQSIAGWREPPFHISQYNDLGYPLTITGKIISPPEVLDRNIRFLLEVDQLRPGRDGQLVTVTGKALVYTRAVSDFQYADIIRVYGLPASPPVFEGFSYRDYLAREDIYTLLYSRESEICRRSWSHPIRKALFLFRSRAHFTLQSLYPDPEASLLSGILLGIEGGISTSMMEAFQNTGTAHIIAISGFNITLISAVILNMLRSWLGRRAGIIAAGISICLYTILVGADAAVVRAALMVAVSLVARLIGRQNQGYNALAAAVFLMTLKDPDILEDVGFQLSAFATLGLLYYGPILEDGFRRQVSRVLSESKTARITSLINECVLLTFAAQLTTMPLTMTYFHQIPVSSLLVNPIILPAQPMIMILGGVSVLVGMICRPAGQLAARVTWPLLSLTTRTVSFFSSFKSATIPLAGNSLPVILFYFVLLIAGTFLATNRTGKKILQKTAAIPVSSGLAAAALCCFLVWTAWAGRSDSRLRITLIPAGQSETLLIQSPAGRTVLLGCGDSPITLSEALGMRLSPFFTRIDWLLLGTSAEQTTAGFPGVAEQYSISRILLSTTRTSPTYSSISALIASKEIPTQVMKSGSILDFHDGVILKIIYVGENGSAYLVQYGNFRLFLTQGEDTDMVYNLSSLSDIEQVSAAILPGSGGLATNPSALLKILDPSLVLLFVEPGAEKNTPHHNILEQLQQRTVLRTDQHGWITLSTDGVSLWVETEYYPDTNP